MLRRLVSAATSCVKHVAILKGSPLKCSANRIVLRNSINLTPHLFTENRIYCTMADNRYAADYAKVGTSSCKKCKQKLEKGSFRIAKVDLC